MTRLRISFLTIILPLYIAALCPAVDAGSGLAFLKMGVGSRAASLGEAYTAGADGALATFWNPAGLTYMDDSEISFTHSQWVQGISSNFFAFAFPLFNGNVGISLNSNRVADLERRTTPSEQPLSVFDANDVALSLSYGHAVSSSFRVGITVKYLYEKIFLESSSGYALDIGTSYLVFDEAIRLALMVQNLGSMNALREQSIRLPTTIRMGLNYRVAIAGASILVLATDVVRLRESDVQGKFGAEIEMKQGLALRIGYQTGFQQGRLSGGFGVQFLRYQFDYGFVPFDSNFGNTHKFSFGLKL